MSEIDRQARDMVIVADAMKMRYCSLGHVHGGNSVAVCNRYIAHYRAVRSDHHMIDRWLDERARATVVEACEAAGTFTPAPFPSVLDYRTRRTERALAPTEKQP